MKSVNLNYPKIDWAFKIKSNYHLTITLFVTLAFCSMNAEAQNTDETAYASMPQPNELAILTITDNEIEIPNCQWCNPSSNCLSVKGWQSGESSECNYYTKVTNLTNARITYKLCLQKLNGVWDCGMEEIGAYKTSAPIYYCNVGNSPRYKIWAAYGELFNTGCDFPEP